MLPKKLGPFAVVEEVSARAFTVTYRARHPTIERSVLVRTLKPTVSTSSAFAEELDREAAVLAELDHPGIIRVIDFARSDAAVFLVLEDRPGVRLTRILESGKLPVEQASAIALGLARALGHAHERGIVHRDLKPSHVELSLAAQIRIVEFSNARAPRMASIPEPIDAGEQLLRPDYMSPEQILGDIAGPRSDVFSLGTIFHQLLSGSLPFDADSSKDVAYRIRNGSPPPLRDIPRTIERVLALCLAKDPDDRFDDARAMAAELETALGALTTKTPEALVAQALVAAKVEITASARALAEKEREAPAPRVTGARGGPSSPQALRSLPFVFALVVGGAAVLETSKDPETSASTKLGDDALFGTGRERGSLRVVASPWADVFIDGELFDTTPIGRSIPVSAGRHWITFRHPNAPDEQRSVNVMPGQLVRLDVVMRIDRPHVDAGAKEAGPPTP